MKKTATKNPGPSIYDAVGAMRGHLDDFLAYWQEKRKEYPDNYPLYYPSQEEWEDQFRAWLELKSLGEGA